MEEIVWCEKKMNDGGVRIMMDDVTRTVDNSCEKDMESVEWGRHSE